MDDSLGTQPHGPLYQLDLHVGLTLLFSVFGQSETGRPEGFVNVK